jgi:polyhydroxyalkanoate synthesis regulator phasin
MSKSPLDAFFIGRATAEAVIDRIEETVTDTLSALGKFDAEQREHIRTFVETILEKAEQQKGTVTTEDSDIAPDELQETIDNLRAEIAQLKSELQQYRDQ